MPVLSLADRMRQLRRCNPRELLSKYKLCLGRCTKEATFQGIYRSRNGPSQDPVGCPPIIPPPSTCHGRSRCRTRHQVISSTWRYTPEQTRHQWSITPYHIRVYQNPGLHHLDRTLPSTFLLRLARRWRQRPTCGRMKTQTPAAALMTHSLTSMLFWQLMECPSILSRGLGRNPLITLR